MNGLMEGGMDVFINSVILKKKKKFTDPSIYDIIHGRTNDDWTIVTLAKW